jgi:heme exporter protein A
MTAILSFKDLTIARGDRVLLRALDGAIAAGDILHIRAALSPFENLRFWTALHGVPDNGIRGALREFELSRVADQPSRQLSAGQKRRTALARLALVRRPL